MYKSERVTDYGLRTHENIVGAIGQTPLVRLNRVSRGLD
jgi:hypothetical protein